MVDALDLESSEKFRESSSLSIRIKKKNLEKSGRMDYTLKWKESIKKKYEICNSSNIGKAIYAKTR